MKRVKLRWWYFVADTIVLCGGFGSRAWLWALRKASDVEWGRG